MRFAYSVVLLLGLACAAAAAQGNDHSSHLKDIRLWAAPHRTRVVFDLDSSVGHDVFTLANPPRVVVDLPDTRRGRHMRKSLAGDGYVAGVRTGIRGGDDLRVVLDLDRNAQPDSFMLAPNGHYGYRLVVDLHAAAGPALNQVQVRPQPQAQPQPKPQPEITVPDFRRHKLVVAVDPGHGGEDPGATGPHGTHEKDVVLKIGRRLAAMINAQPGMRAVLTRHGDYYVGLRERIDEARKAKADLFVSVHADASRSRYAHGSTVYVLSRHGASSEHARWLAQRENSADLIGGVSLRNKDAQLASFMLDLSQGASIEASLDAGGRVLRDIRHVNPLHKTKVQQAGFVVLKSPDIPSMLVETAYISNPKGERKLRSPRFRRHMARAILAGIKGYFASYRPAGGAVVKTTRYKVRPGDTLSGIALRYGMSVAGIRRANNLHTNRLRVGQNLSIPMPNDSQLASSSP